MITLQRYKVILLGPLLYKVSPTQFRVAILKVGYMASPHYLYVANATLTRHLHQEKIVGTV